MESYPSLEIPSEDVLLGTPEGRNLSPVRRFFCLLVTFDLLFTVLLWTLCVILVRNASLSIPDALELEVFHYNFHQRIFDIVMCAACRFTILLLFYALLSCHHWFPVAFTTTTTCSFLLVKVFMFDWSEFENATYPVMLVLASFILSWSEAWFLDFRVVPQERQAAIFHYRQSTLGGNPVSFGSQGVLPWLSQTVSQIARNTPTNPSYPESHANFYSPLESPIPSDGENEHSETESMEKKLRLLKHTAESTDSKLWIQQGPLIAKELLNLIRASGWVLEKTTESGDNVFSKKAHRKIYMISGTISVPTSKIIFELFQNFETMPNWNPAVSHCQILQTLNPVTDVSYQVSKEGAKGAVSSRDFVTLRHHMINGDNGTEILAWVSVKHNDKPKQPGITRGTNGTGGWVFTPCCGDHTKTEYQWLLDVDLHLQGWIPKKIVEMALINASLDTVKCLRNKIAFNTIDQIDVRLDIDGEQQPSNSNNSRKSDRTIINSKSQSAS